MSINFQAINKKAKVMKEYMEWNSYNCKHYIKKDAPEWVHDIVRAAHEGSLPNDAIFDLVYHALSILEEVSNEDELQEYINSYVPHYNQELINWLSNDPYAISAVNEAREEFGPTDDIMRDLQMGYAYRLNQIAYFLIGELQDLEIEAA